MTGQTPREGSLVLYKNRPARVRRAGAKLEIELEGIKVLSVRPKDVTLLHLGPMAALNELVPPLGDVETAWELLAGDEVGLADLAELVFGAYTPATAWAAWELVADGLYFYGTPERVSARLPIEVERESAAREAKDAARAAWAAFVERLRSGRYAPEDREYIRDVEALALGERKESRVLRELGRAGRPENAHALLLELGYWDATVNPYPQRLGLSTSPPAVTLRELPEEARVDLTHLPAFAIDDEGNQDPDDALSLEGDRLWVHIADVASVVRPGGEADLEARTRGATLYLPEGTAPMLPPAAARVLGLGLNKVSPALSFGMNLNREGEVVGLELMSSWVRVTRLTYAEADARLEDEVFQRLYRLARTHESRRLENGAVALDLPEVKVQVENGEVSIHPVPPFKSRTLVTEAMLMAGEATARFALEHEIPFPYSTQDPPTFETAEQPTSLAGMFALRMGLRRSRIKSSPTPHYGLGLEVYTQVTSPLRRYLDLVAHQQLRAFLHGGELLGTQELVGRIGSADAVTYSVRQAERLSRRHWTLVYLLQHPDWPGEGVLVDKRGSLATILIPELDLEPRLHLRDDLPFDSPVPLVFKDVDLSELEVYFQVVR